jgi:hypothetical protein
MRGRGWGGWQEKLPELTEREFGAVASPKADPDRNSLGCFDRRPTDRVARQEMDETREPRWWAFELRFSDHAKKRIADRGISELEVRTILVGPVRIAPDPQPGRIRVTGSISGTEWTIVLEPDLDQSQLIVVTVFRND